MTRYIIRVNHFTKIQKMQFAAHIGVYNPIR